MTCFEIKITRPCGSFDLRGHVTRGHVTTRPRDRVPTADLYQRLISFRADKVYINYIRKK